LPKQETQTLLHVPTARSTTTRTTNHLHTENKEDRAHERETQNGSEEFKRKKKKRKNLIKEIKENKKALTGYH